MDRIKQDISAIVGLHPNVWLANPKVIIPQPIPLSECLPILARHEVLLSAFSNALPDDEVIVITSTSMDYTGKPRTLSNGKNHVQNQGLDFIIVTKESDNHYSTVRSFPYSRSVLVIMMVAIAIAKGYKGRVCLEDDHIHVHHAEIFTGVLQMVKGKNRSNANSDFLCSTDHASYLHIDFTSFANLISKKKF